MRIHHHPLQAKRKEVKPLLRKVERSMPRLKVLKKVLSPLLIC
jgi:hypothetical protein